MEESATIGTFASRASRIVEAGISLTKAQLDADARDLDVAQALNELVDLLRGAVVRRKRCEHKYASPKAREMDVVRLRNSDIAHNVVQPILRDHLGVFLHDWQLQQLLNGDAHRFSSLPVPGSLGRFFPPSAGRRCGQTAAEILRFYHTILFVRLQDFRPLMRLSDEIVKLCA